MDVEKTIEFLLHYQRQTAEQIQTLAERQIRVETHLQSLTEQQAALVQIVAQQQNQIGGLLSALGTMTEGQRSLTEAHFGLTEIQRKSLDQFYTMAQQVEALARTCEEWIRRTGFPPSRPN